MKKYYLYAGMLAAGMLAFSACSDDDNPINGGAGNPEVAAGEQVIVLDMQDTDVLSTKSRPLYSTENKGAELVTDVKLMVFKHQEGAQMQLEQVISIPNWDQTSTDYNYGRKLTIKLGTDYDSDKLETGNTYTIYAVGQDATAQTPAPFTVNGNHTIADLVINNGLQDGLTWNGNTEVGEGFVKTDSVKYWNEAGNAFQAQAVGEIFSGISDPVNITLDGGFTAEVLLKRQVAGVLGYFSRIPAWVVTDAETGVHKSVGAIRLVASSRNYNIDLTNKLGVQADDATGELPIESVVNGFNADDVNLNADAQYSSSADAYVVYTIDLAKWFTTYNEANTTNQEYWSDGTNLAFDKDWETNLGTDVPLLGINTDAWYNPYNPANTGTGSVIVAPNAVLAGEFVIPFNLDPSKNTFEVQLLDSTKTEVIKAWDVNLDEASRSGDDQEKIYNIYRNHLYQIGQRGDGDDPDNPGKDPDKPQPLDKDQELTIKINDQWEFIHNMEIE